MKIEIEIVEDFVKLVKAQAVIERLGHKPNYELLLENQYAQDSVLPSENIFTLCTLEGSILAGIKIKHTFSENGPKIKIVGLFDFKNNLMETRESRLTIEGKQPVSFCRMIDFLKSYGVIGA